MAITVDGDSKAWSCHAVEVLQFLGVPVAGRMNAKVMNRSIGPQDENPCFSKVAKRSSTSVARDDASRMDDEVPASDFRIIFAAKPVSRFVAILDRAELGSA